MADIRVLTYRTRILLEQGWFCPGWGRMPHAVAREVAPVLQAVTDREADEAFARDVTYHEQLVAQWQVLTDAGITDPVAPDPSGCATPERSDYQFNYPVLVARIPANRNSGRIGGYIGQPFGSPVWISALVHGDGQVGFGGTSSSWSYTEEDALAACDDANGVGRFHYDRYVDRLRQADAADRRSLRDWEIISAAGLTPTWPKPVLVERIPDGYDVWRAAALESRAQSRGPLYQVVRVEPNTPKPAGD